ncbi:hypothetical protein HPB47_006327 [Ixodes persulcatus]|uniref:Uncharacterized protein n=1 Tax=Ixodes persulcatus TaxID=34615 RepID=A0AC60PAK1_IXOPE|nr:hypothetical protein HPB47_006327 [Ixodes persulcatus]
MSVSPAEEDDDVSPAPYQLDNVQRAVHNRRQPWAAKILHVRSLYRRPPSRRLLTWTAKAPLGNGITKKDVFVRYNDRLNLIAVEVLNEQATQVLLKTTDLCRIPVRPYLALSGQTTVGVIRDVDMDATEEQLEHNLRSESKIVDIRRLGKSSVVKLTFQGSQLPNYVLLGYVRHPVLPYKEKPLQCHNCGGFGHKKVSCTRAMACKRCGEQHEATDAMCQSPTLRCVNCKRDHEAISHACPKWIKERKILTYSKTNSIGFCAARSAVEGQKESRSGEEDAQPEILSKQAKQLSNSRAVTYASVTGGTHSLPPNTEAAHGSAGNGAHAAATSEPSKQTPKQPPQTRQRSSTQEGDAEDKSASSVEAPGWTSTIRAAANIAFAISRNIEASWARTVTTILQTMIPLLGVC